ncbi:hypothetical protein CYMTET_19791 [Cymbomonas tetramitiformis]|uniref:PKD/REJ-like domain-containing protein n=1 Tax=Cymbomonas tetramitiformis TaxID=36881 RepID=A0AAE0G5C1_9CHLO|nr:hypothetical protein CYMTET_19791 [Cymbomonas tetramitiformis]
MLDASTLMTSVTQEALVVRPDVLLPGAAYSFQLAASDGYGLASATVKVVMNTPPAGGDVVVDPVIGVALETSFAILSPGWDDEDGPLWYQQSYHVVGEGEGEGATWRNLVSDFSTLPSPFRVHAVLPRAGLKALGYGVTVRSTVSDTLGATAHAETNITVAPSEVVDTEAVLRRAQSRLQNGEADSAMQYTTGLGAVLNDAYSATISSSVPLQVALRRRRRLADAVLGEGEAAAAAAEREELLDVVGAVHEMLFTTSASTTSLAEAVDEVTGAPCELTAASQGKALELVDGLVAGAREVDSEVRLTGEAAMRVVAALSSVNEAGQPSTCNASNASSAARRRLAGTIDGEAGGANQTAECMVRMEGVAGALLMGSADGEDPQEVDSPTLGLSTQRCRADLPDSCLFTQPLAAPAGWGASASFPASLGAKIAEAVPPASRRRMLAEAPPPAGGAPLPRLSVDARVIVASSELHHATPVASESNRSLIEEQEEEAAAAKMEEVDDFIDAGGGSMRVVLLDENGGELQVEGLSEAVEVRVPLGPEYRGTVAEVEARTGRPWVGHMGCRFWDEVNATYSPAGCHALPNPAPAGAGLYWRSLVIEGEEAGGLAALWGVGNAALTAGCEEVWGAALEEYNGTDAGRRKYGNVTGTADGLVWAATGCALVDGGANATLGCRWEWRRQMFEGPECVLAAEQSCVCTHLTDFTATEQLDVSTADPPELQTLRLSDMTSVTLSDVLKSVLLLSVAFGLISSTIGLGVICAWSDTASRQSILERLIKHHGTGIHGFRKAAGGAWTWGVFEEEWMAGVERKTQWQYLAERAAKTTIMTGIHGKVAALYGEEALMHKPGIVERMKAVRQPRHRRRALPDPLGFRNRSFPQLTSKLRTHLATVTQGDGACARGMAADGDGAPEDEAGIGGWDTFCAPDVWMLQETGSHRLCVTAQAEREAGGTCAVARPVLAPGTDEARINSEHADPKTFHDLMPAEWQQLYEDHPLTLAPQHTVETSATSSAEGAGGEEKAEGMRLAHPLEGPKTRGLDNHSHGAPPSAQQRPLSGGPRSSRGSRLADRGHEPLRPTPLLDRHLEHLHGREVVENSVTWRTPALQNALVGIEQEAADAASVPPAAPFQSASFASPSAPAAEARWTRLGRWLWGISRMGRRGVTLESLDRAGVPQPVTEAHNRRRMGIGRAGAMRSLRDQHASQVVQETGKEGPSLSLVRDAERGGTLSMPSSPPSMVPGPEQKEGAPRQRGLTLASMLPGLGLRLQRARGASAGSAEVKWKSGQTSNFRTVRFASKKVANAQGLEGILLSQPQGAPAPDVAAARERQPLIPGADVCEEDMLLLEKALRSIDALMHADEEEAREPIWALLRASQRSSDIMQEYAAAEPRAAPGAEPTDAGLPTDSADELAVKTVMREAVTAEKPEPAGIAVLPPPLPAAAGTPRSGSAALEEGAPSAGCGADCSERAPLDMLAAAGVGGVAAESAELEPTENQLHAAVLQGVAGAGSGNSPVPHSTGLGSLMRVGVRVAREFGTGGAGDPGGARHSVRGQGQETTGDYRSKLVMLRRREIARKQSQIRRAAEVGERLDSLGQLLVRHYMRTFADELHVLQGPDPLTWRAALRTGMWWVENRVQRRRLVLKFKCCAVFVRLLAGRQDLRATDALCGIMGFASTALTLHLPMPELRRMTEPVPEQKEDPHLGSRRGRESAAGNMAPDLPEARGMTVERVLGTALVLAFLYMGKIVQQAQVRAQVDLVRGLPWGRTPVPIEEYVTWFKVMLKVNRRQEGWYHRSQLWSLVFLRSPEGCFDLSPGLATVLHAGETSSTLMADAMAPVPVTELLDSLPQPLRRAGLSSAHAEQVWATLLAAAKLTKLPFAWVLNPQDKPSQQLTLLDSANAYLDSLATEHASLSAELPALRDQAHGLVTCWTNSRLDAIRHLRERVVANTALTEAQLSGEERRAAFWKRWRSRAEWVLMRHPWVAIAYTLPSDPYSRTQRMLVQCTSLLAMLLITLWLFYSKGVQCCIGFKEHLECPDASVESECWGRTTCEDLYLAHKDGALPDHLAPDAYSCKAFPQKTLADTLWLSSIVLLIMVPLNQTLHALFRVGGTPVVPSHWRSVNKQQHTDHLQAPRAASLENALFLVLAFTLETNRLSRALARYFRVVAYFLDAVFNYLLKIWYWGMDRLPWVMTSIWLLWQVHICRRNVHIVLQELEVAARQRDLQNYQRLQALATFTRARHELQSTSTQLGYTILVLLWAMLLWFQLSYAVLIRSMLGEGAERDVITEWMITILVDNLCINVFYMIMLRSLVQWVLQMRLKVSKVERGIIGWYEGYLTEYHRCTYTMTPIWGKYNDEDSPDDHVVM